MSSTNNKHSYNLSEGSIQASLIRMTTPMIIGMLMLFSFSLIDTFFIGFLGTEALTAISFTFPLTFTILSLAIGLGIGASAVVGKYLGRSDYEKAKQASTVINYISLILATSIVMICWFFMDEIFHLMGASESLMPAIRDYMVVWFPGSIMVVCIMTGNSILRACGDTKTPSILMAGMGFINAALDPIFIFGLGPMPALGIQGAAWATVVGWGIGYCYLMYILVIKKELVSGSLPSRSVMISSGREMLRIGVPAAGANMLTPLAAGIMTRIAAGFSGEAVAAFGVGARLEPLATLIVLAMSSSLPPLISQNFGAGKISRVEEAYRLSIKFILGWQMLVYIVLALGAGIIASMFTKDPEVIQAIKLFLWILPLGYGMQGIIILTNSSLNALHRPMTALYLSLARFFVFYVPLAYLGSQWFGLMGFFGGAFCGNLLMAAISLRTFNKTISDEQLSHPAPAENAS